MAGAVKFYMDEHIHPAITAGLRGRGADVTTAQEAGLASSADEVHLAFARDHGRVLVTLDADFTRLHASGTQHCGIAYAPRNSAVGHVLRALVLIYQVLDSDDMINRLEFI